MVQGPNLDFHARRWAWGLIAFGGTAALLLSCGGARPRGEPEAASAHSSAAREGEVAAAEGTSAATAEGRRSADLYEGCRRRVEGAEVAGECATDADCVRAGCSQEICLSSGGAHGEL
jgi:hypothetical protein